ncbi:hypothetical protein ACSBR2_016993 [Camellia fascicularis]
MRLALGLELSSQRFLWIVRSHNNKSASAAFFTTERENDPFSFLPKAFLERTQERGLVVPLWALQIEVLSHHATGGFVTHYMWNSTLESIVNGNRAGATRRDYKGCEKSYGMRREEGSLENKRTEGCRRKGPERR